MTDYDLDQALAGLPGFDDKPVPQSTPLLHGPAPTPAGATHPHRLPVPLAVFMSYEYLADTMGVAEAPLPVMRYEGFRKHLRNAYTWGEVDDAAKAERARLSTAATIKRAAVKGHPAREAIDAYFAFRQAQRDAGLMTGARLGPPAGPDTVRGRRGKQEAAKQLLARDMTPAPRHLEPYQDPEWWLRVAGETGREWHARLERMILPPPAQEATLGEPRADPEVIQKRRDAARLRRVAKEQLRSAERASLEEAAAAAPDPLTLVAGAPVRTLTREEDVARRLSLPWAERVREDVACIVALGRPLPAIPCTTARIAAERGL